MPTAKQIRKRCMGVDGGIAVVVRGAVGAPVGAELRKREKRVHLRYRPTDLVADSLEGWQRIMMVGDARPIRTRQVLQHFLRIHGGRPETIRSFVGRFGYLGLEDDGWPSGWAHDRWSRAGSEGDDGIATEQTGEPCSHYARYAALAWAVVRGAEYLREHATLSTQARRAIARDLTPLGDHWKQFRGRWIAKNRDLIYIEGIPESVGTARTEYWRAIAFGKDSPRHAGDMDLTVERLLAGTAAPDWRAVSYVTASLTAFVDWWMEAGRCYPTLAMAEVAPPVLRIAYGGGAWAALGQAMLQVLGGIRALATCDQCGRPIARTRAPKRGQAALCSSECRRARNTHLKAESRRRAGAP